MSKEMPNLLVPDQYREGVWPKSLSISPVIEDWLDGDYKDTFEKHWKAFGSRDTIAPPDKPPIPQVTQSVLATSDLFASYGEVAIKLRNAYDGLETADENVAKFVKEAGKHGDEFQDKLKDLIDTLGIAAAQPPQGNMTEDEHIMTYVTEGLNAGTDTMTKAHNQLDKDGSDVNGQTDEVKKLTAEVEALKNQNKSLQQQLASGGGGGGGGTTYDPNLLGQQGSNGGDGSYTPLNFGLDGAGAGQTGTGGSLTDGLSNGSNSASDPSGLGTGSTGSASPISATPAGMTSPDAGMSPLGSGMGSGMGGMGGMGDMMSQMLPMLAQMQMMRQMQDQGLNGRNGGLQPAYPQQPVVSAQPASTTPQQTQPAASPASATAQSDAAPKGASSSQTQQAGAVPPGRTPGADGTVEYPFPDGRTQKVSVIVAQALDAAFGNHGGTDAQKAYEKTTAKWTDNKQIGDHVDPSQLMTGDVVVWEKATAILVVFGSGTDGSIEAIIDGNLQKLDSDKMDTMSGKAGEFGTFTEFQHPRGIEATAPDHQADSAPGMPMPGDHQGGVLSAAVGTPT
ncbi:hypothetical protein [Nocardia africana]|uniref:Uncharacterized protein n=1 Tax=Nocardia africana TaxID=134964 RepID=A0A378WME0_9NOCA|nr:hypothetical protein [Nocardia africana]MCC3315298.1 hypothetical protein [Nocardia africana]SUA42399.1 Uncharacterised protein [Nocardia africana]